MDAIYHDRIREITDAYLNLQLEIPSEDEIASQQVLSRRFLRRMNRLVKKARKHNTPAKANASSNSLPVKKRLLAAAIICVLIASAVSVYAYRETVAGFVIEVYEKFTSVIFPDSNESSDTTVETVNDNIEDNMPSYIPKGYILVDQITSYSLVEIVYADETGSELIFTKMRREGTQMGLDTEGISIEEVSINGATGLYFSKNGQNSLVWSDDDYAFSLIGTIDKNSLIDIAISTK